MSSHVLGGLPSSPACERNKQPILERLQGLLAESSHVVEIGSGTGQHAAHFAGCMPWLVWQCTDRHEYLDGLNVRIGSVALPNLPAAVEFDVFSQWPAGTPDAVFSANTAHIMSWTAVEAMFMHVDVQLSNRGRFILYGPFHYDGKPTGAGNAIFDRELQLRGNSEGIRDVERIGTLAAEHRLHLLLDAAMPANNRLLAWEKRS